MTGIYAIKNKVNNKMYIGQALNIKNRWSNHKTDLNHNKHQNEHLQRAWNKYGEANFIFFTLEECDETELTNKEQYWIDYFGGIKSTQLYNQKDAGNKGRLSEDVKHKISKSQKGVSKPKGRKVSIEGKLSLSKSHAGKTHSMKTRHKMSLAQKGRHHSEETKRKISMKNKQRFIENPQLAIDISNRCKNRKLSDETRKKIGDSSRGRKYGIETSKKHSKSLIQAYKEGRRKTVQITVFGVTKTQTEWAKILNVPHTSIIYQRKKGTAESYIEKSIIKIVEKKGEMANALVDGKVSVDNSTLLQYLLS